MRLRQISCGVENHPGEGPGGTWIQGDLRAQRQALLSRYAGQVQAVYLDPPFNTGKSFTLRQRCGDAGWLTGKPVLEVPAYADVWPGEEEFLALVREAAQTAHELLREDGSFFLHIDARMHARIRLMLDEIFGGKNFVNEIIWTYQTGGRSTRHFSRKHDIILFFRKSRSAYFNIRAVGTPRGESRHNHMRRAVDADGRTYRAIVSYGKEYRYYDDDPVYPSDVWDDISHLQQKDPQRTGYDNQKPLALLERIILCSTRPGDLVCDLFAGSGTTAAAAAKHGRGFIALDSAPVALAVARKRLLTGGLRIEAPCALGAPMVYGEVEPGEGRVTMGLTEYRLEPECCPLALPGISAVDQVSIGYVADGVFYASQNAVRTKATPGLPLRMKMPRQEGQPAFLTVDVLGRRMVHAGEEKDGE